MLVNKSILLTDPNLQNDIIRKHFIALGEGIKTSKFLGMSLYLRSVNTFGNGLLDGCQSQENDVYKPFQCRRRVNLISLNSLVSLCNIYGFWNSISKEGKKTKKWLMINNTLQETLVLIWKRTEINKNPWKLGNDHELT